MSRRVSTVLLLVAAIPLSILSTLGPAAAKTPAPGGAALTQAPVRSFGPKSGKVVSFNRRNRVLKVRRANGNLFVGNIRRGKRVRINGTVKRPAALGRGDEVVKLRARWNGAVRQLRVARAGNVRDHYRVNAGGTGISGTPQWTRDPSARPSNFLTKQMVKATTVVTTAATVDTAGVPAGTPAALFKTVREDTPAAPDMTWRFPVAAGDYDVTLYFAETSAAHQSVGARVFDVLAEGNTELDDYDVFAEVGPNKAVVKSFVTSVTDGALDVTFRHVAGNSALAAIEVKKAMTPPSPEPTPGPGPGPEPGPSPSPSPSPTPSCSGVSIAPGTSLSNAISANGNETVFCIQPGTHVVTGTLSPKTGQQFIGAPGAVLTGQNKTAYAFRGGGSNVVLKNLIIEHFETPLQTAAVDSAGASGWVIQGNEVRDNAGIGICIDTNGRMLDNYIHHQGQMGICAHGSDGLIEGNEIAFNNTDGVDWYWEAGGSKFVNSTRLTLRDNHVHDNVGPGLWTDYQNVDTLFENNLVENNVGPGIFHEISYRATIRNNVVRNNAHQVKGDKTIWWGGAGIVVANSSDVEVYGNTLVNNNGGIGVIQTDRGSGNLGLFESRNVNVHDNAITIRTGTNGLVTVDNTYFTSKGNSFTNNKYYLDTMGAMRFNWNNSAQTSTNWKSFGMDVNGTFTLAP